MIEYKNTNIALKSYVLWIFLHLYKTPQSSYFSICLCSILFSLSVCFLRMANSLFCTCHSHREKEKRDSRYRGLLLDSMDLHSGAMAPRPVWALMLPWDPITATSSRPSKHLAGLETQRSRSGAAGLAANVAPVNWISVITGLRSFVWRRLGGLPRLRVVMGEELGISRRQLDKEQRKSRDYKSQVLRDRSVLFPTTTEF